MKRIAYILCWMALSPLHATAFTAEQMVKAVQETSASIKVMSCGFVQTRWLTLLDDSVQSCGRLLYRAPADLKWEYTEPEWWCLEVSDGKASVIGRENDGSERLFSGIAGVMLDCMSGKCLTDRRMFTVRMTEETDAWRACLTPVRKDMSRIFSSVTLVFDPGTCLLRTLEMLEAGGNVTRIVISDVSINGEYETDR